MVKQKKVRTSVRGKLQRSTSYPVRSNTRKLPEVIGEILPSDADEVRLENRDEFGTAQVPIIPGTLYCNLADNCAEFKAHFRSLEDFCACDLMKESEDTEDEGGSRFQQAKETCMTVISDFFPTLSDVLTPTCHDLAGSDEVFATREELKHKRLKVSKPTPVSSPAKLAASELIDEAANTGGIHVRKSIIPSPNSVSTYQRAGMVKPVLHPIDPFVGCVNLPSFKTSSDCEESGPEKKSSLVFDKVSSALAKITSDLGRLGADIACLGSRNSFEMSERKYLKSADVQRTGKRNPLPVFGRCPCMSDAEDAKKPAVKRNPPPVRPTNSSVYIPFESEHHKPDHVEDHHQRFENILGSDVKSVGRRYSGQDTGSPSSVCRTPTGKRTYMIGGRKGVVLGKLASASKIVEKYAAGLRRSKESFIALGIVRRKGKDPCSGAAQSSLENLPTAPESTHLLDSVRAMCRKGSVTSEVVDKYQNVVNEFSFANNKNPRCNTELKDGLKGKACGLCRISHSEVNIFKRCSRVSSGEQPTDREQAPADPSEQRDYQSTEIAPNVILTVPKSSVQPQNPILNQIHAVSINQNPSPVSASTSSGPGRTQGSSDARCQTEEPTTVEDHLHYDAAAGAGPSTTVTMGIPVQPRHSIDEAYVKFWTRGADPESAASTQGSSGFFYWNDEEDRRAAEAAAVAASHVPMNDQVKLPTDDNEQRNEINQAVHSNPELQKSASNSLLNKDAIADSTSASLRVSSSDWLASAAHKSSDIETASKGKREEETYNDVKPLAETVAEVKKPRRLSINSLTSSKKLTLKPSILELNETPLNKRRLGAPASLENALSPMLPPSKEVARTSRRFSLPSTVFFELPKVSTNSPSAKLQPKWQTSSHELLKPSQSLSAGEASSKEEKSPPLKRSKSRSRRKFIAKLSKEDIKKSVNLLDRPGVGAGVRKRAIQFTASTRHQQPGGNPDNEEENLALDFIADREVPIRLPGDVLRSSAESDVEDQNPDTRASTGEPAGKGGVYALGLQESADMEPVDPTASEAARLSSTSSSLRRRTSQHGASFLAKKAASIIDNADRPLKRKRVHPPAKEIQELMSLKNSELFLKMFKISKQIREDEGNFLCAPFYVSQWAVLLCSGLSDKVGKSFSEAMGIPGDVDVNRVFRYAQQLLTEDDPPRRAEWMERKSRRENNKRNTRVKILHCGEDALDDDFMDFLKKNYPTSYEKVTPKVAEHLMLKMMPYRLAENQMNLSQMILMAEQPPRKNSSMILFCQYDSPWVFAFRNEPTIVNFCNDGKKSQCRGVPGITFSHGEAIHFSDESTSSHLIQLQHPTRRSYSLLLVVPFEKDGLAKTEAEISPATLDMPHNMSRKFKSVKLIIPSFRVDLDRRMDLTLKRIGLKDMISPNSVPLRGIHEVPYSVETAAQWNYLQLRVVETGEDSSVSDDDTTPPLTTIHSNSLTVDHPFLVFVLHTHSRSLLAGGRITRLGIR